LQLELRAKLPYFAPRDLQRLEAVQFALQMAMKFLVPVLKLVALESALELVPGALLAE
jgi:hypothetical protein